MHVAAAADLAGCGGAAADRPGLSLALFAACSGRGGASAGLHAGGADSLVGLGASKGVFVTTSGFSAPTVEYVRHLPQRAILIDGARLAELMIEHGVGVRVSRTVEVKRIDEDFFAED